MCTVSIIPVRRFTTDAYEETGFRLAFSRDELRTRAGGLPPVVRRIGERTAVTPLDPVSGGTWVGANDAGLVLALLNVTRSKRGASDGATASRGTIIPSLLECGDVADAVDRALGMDASRYEPFRLLVLDRRECVELMSDGWEVRERGRWELARPLMFTSSGLGDRLVEGPRGELFRQMVGPAATEGDQDAFHGHQWPDRPEVSVRMSRTDARTVSYCVVECFECELTMAYHGEGPGAGTPAVARRLGVRAVSCV